MRRGHAQRATTPEGKPHKEFWDGPRLTWAVALLLIGLTVAAHQPALQCDFVSYDDPMHVTGNSHVLQGLTWSNFLWSLTEWNGSWHPLTWWSWMVDVEIYGVNPIGFHLTNLVWHTGSVVLLFLTLQRMTGRLWPSALVASLFAVHPLNVESVAWVSERKGLISGFFAILTIWCYVRYAERPGFQRYAWVMLCLSLGLMAKAMLVTLPCVLLLLDYWPLQRWRNNSAQSLQALGISGERRWPTRSSWELVVEKVPLLVIVVLCSAVAILAQRSVGAMASLQHVSLADRFNNALTSYVVYLWRAAYPLNLSAFYPLPQPARPWWQMAAAVFLLVAVSGIVAWQARRWPYLIVGWLWFLGMLLPVSGILQVGGHAEADRYAYLPLVGLFVSFAWGLDSLAKHYQLQRMAASGAVLLIASFAILSWAQIPHWRDGFSLWNQSIRVTGGSERAFFNLGVLWLERGELERAKECLEQARAYEAHSPEVEHNLGLALLGLDDPAGAAACFQEVLKTSPNDAKSQMGLGLALLDLEQFPQAVRHLQAAVRLDPDSAHLCNYLGIAYEHCGQWEEAVSWHRRALSLDGMNAQFQRDLAFALLNTSDEAAARKMYGQSLQLDPDWPRRQLELVWRLVADSPSAASHGKSAVRLALQIQQAASDSDPRILDALAAAYAEDGRFGDAAASAQQAVALAKAEGHTELAADIERRRVAYEQGKRLRDDLGGRPANDLH